jgi:sialate O-acetylesterase
MILPILLWGVGISAATAAADPCSPDPCVHGMCSRSGAAFACACSVGFDGLYCEIPALIAVVFSSNMVLARAPQSAVVFGAGNSTVPYDAVTVSLSGGGTWRVEADAAGAWSLTLPPHPATTVGLSLSAVSNATGRAVVLTNVVFGDVFVCAGQSNVALAVSGGYVPYASAAEVEAWAPRYQNVRLLNNGNFWPWFPSKPGSTPMGSEAGNPPGFRLPTSGNGTWQNPGTIANFSATCWFFGASLYDTLGGTVPIGLIDNSAGGTSIIFWSSPETASACNATTPGSPQPPDHRDYGVLFNSMIQPLSPMALSGIIFFQGESNACGYAAAGQPCGGSFYACQLRALINDWRLKLKAPALPFLVTELGALVQPQWPNMRAAMQAAVSGLANAGTVVNHDLGWHQDMHSRRKVALGRRQQLWMLANGAYRNASVSWSGPALERVVIAAGASGVVVSLFFTPATSAGLHFNGTADCAYNQPHGFVCCGATDSPVFLRVENVSAADGSGYTWARTAPPAVDATAGAVTAAFANASAVDLSRVRLGFEGWPTCALYNGVGGPDWGDAVAAEPFDVALDAAGHATPVPVPACIAPCPVEGAPADCCGPQ